MPLIDTDVFYGVDDLDNIAADFTAPGMVFYIQNMIFDLNDAAIFELSVCEFFERRQSAVWPTFDVHIFEDKKMSSYCV